MHVSVSTKDPMWGHPMLVLGALCSFLEPFCGHSSPKINKVSEELTLRYPHEGPWVVPSPMPTFSCKEFFLETNILVERWIFFRRGGAKETNGLALRRRVSASGSGFRVQAYIYRRILRGRCFVWSRYPCMRLFLVGDQRPAARGPLAVTDPQPRLRG